VYEMAGHPGKMVWGVSQHVPIKDPALGAMRSAAIPANDAAAAQSVPLRE
jgi:hypothetical protein